MTIMTFVTTAAVMFVGISIVALVQDRMAR